MIPIFKKRSIQGCNGEIENYLWHVADIFSRHTKFDKKKERKVTIFVDKKTYDWVNNWLDEQYVKATLYCGKYGDEVKRFKYYPTPYCLLDVRLDDSI